MKRSLALMLVLGPFVAALSLVVLAWGYIWFLMHPGCRDENPARGAPTVEVWLPVEEKAKLKAWFTPPSNGVVVIALGGLEGALGDRLPPVQFLIAQGYGALQIDSRACARPALAVTLGAREAEDVAAALEYLRQQGGVKQVGIFGYSMGAAAAIRAAARYPGIAAVAAEGGYYNLGEDIVESDGSDPFVRKIFLYTIAGAYRLQSGVNPWQISPISDLPKISPRPVLLIYGEQEAGSGRAEDQFAAAGSLARCGSWRARPMGRITACRPRSTSRRFWNFSTRLCSSDYGS